jgi:uncharacterized protein YndB with AHSA1/START domain
MTEIAVARGIWIAAPRERVWQAISSPEQIAGWLLPPALGAHLTRDADGRLLVALGPMEIPIAQFADLAPQQHLTLRSLPDQQIAATFTLRELDGGTQVSVALTGFEQFAEDARHDRLAPSAQGWERTLHNLQAVVAGAALPFPEGYVAALFGYRRETSETFAVERSIWIAAPRERVWQAVTNPADYAQWFSPGTAWQLTALEPGGKLFARDAATGAEQHTQIITQVEPPQRFALRTVPEPSGSVEVTTYAFREERGGTRLTVTNAGYALLPEDARSSSMEQNAFGFGLLLENVRAFVEGRPLPSPGGF